MYHEFMDAFIQFLIDWGYWGMFLSAFLAGTILPFSSEVVLLACIGLGLDPVWSTLFTTAGNALGGFTCYWIGRIGKTEWIEKYFKVDKKQMDKAIRFIHGRGSWMAFFLISACHWGRSAYRTGIYERQCLDYHYCHDYWQTGSLCHYCGHSFGSLPIHRIENQCKFSLIKRYDYLCEKLPKIIYEKFNKT